MLKLPLITRRLLASYLVLGVDPPDDEPDNPDGADNPDKGADAGGGADGADSPDNIEDLDLDGDEGAESGSDGDGDHGAMLRKATERAEKAEREAREVREELQRSRSNAGGQPAAPTDEQKLFEQEEAILNNPQSTEQQKYWVKANRTLRENQRMARDAQMQAHDSRDRAAYERLMAERPVAKKYEKRVEDKLAEIRKGGHNLDRKFVLAMVIGMDIVDGKVKTAKRAPAEGGQQRQGADRGNPPRARSDVRGRSGASERDKRNARLENQPI